jgi:hypothetical protein
MTIIAKMFVTVESDPDVAWSSLWTSQGPAFHQRSRDAQIQRNTCIQKHILDFLVHLATPDTWGGKRSSCFLL